MEIQNYWLTLFNVKTWEEFLTAGGKVAGFRDRHYKVIQRIKPNDYLICYLTGASRFIGSLEVKSVPYIDDTPVWREEDFPYRIKVNPLIILTPTTAVPVLELKNNLSLFNNLKNPNSWSAYFRRSPTRMLRADGKAVIDALIQAKNEPITRPLDNRNIARSLKHKQPFNRACDLS